MTDTDSFAPIELVCREISLQLMKIHPAMRELQDEEIKGEIIKHAHAMTVEIEAMKKKILRARKRDDSTDL